MYRPGKGRWEIFALAAAIVCQFFRHRVANAQESIKYVCQADRACAAVVTMLADTIFDRIKAETMRKAIKLLYKRKAILYIAHRDNLRYNFARPKQK